MVNKVGYAELRYERCMSTDIRQILVGKDSHIMIKMTEGDGYKELYCKLALDLMIN